MNWDTEDFTERAPSLDRDGRAAYRIVSNGLDVSTAVIEAVTEVADCDRLADECILYDVVDPDALNRLFENRSGGTAGATGRIVFELNRCRVEVRADGNHVVYEPDNSGDSSASTAQSA
ncbi:hypothetical protein M0R89_19640 (plasmid) [Halorussus limi]|uniref:Halobacterial output domain-containing protein n=1 Tax=Halorussus limi TaxID=2938695 RepID=A0A8U0HZ10_9EURY|nr:HalOD1 output domain-containing protein [Halorussus limi]UPV76375.1 hypothetical protein M0R89_19640 [Halorussus limi]